MKKNTTLLSAAVLSSALLFGACVAPSSSSTASTTSDATQETVTEAESIPAPTRESVDFSWDGKNISDYVTLGEYENITYVPDDTTVSEEEVNGILDEMLSASVSYEHLTTGTVKDGDTVNIDFAGFMDGVQFDGGTAQSQMVTIGVSRYIEGFLESIIGADVGDTVTADIAFPDDYFNEELAGKPVTFNITINYIQGEEISAELTDEWVTSYTNGEYTTVEGLKGFITDQLTAQKTESAASNNQAKVWAKVVENATLIEYPEGLVEYYAVDQKNMIMDYAAYSGLTYEDYISKMNYSVEDVEKMIQSYAEGASLSALVNQAVAEKYQLTVNDEEYQAHLQELASKYGYTDLDQMVMDAGGELQIRDSLLYNKVIEKVMASAVEVAEEETVPETETAGEEDKETPEETGTAAETGTSAEAETMTETETPAEAETPEETGTKAEKETSAR